MSVQQLEDAFKLKEGQCNHIPRKGDVCDHLFHMKEITEGIWLVRIDMDGLPYEKEIPLQWEGYLESIGWEVVIKENTSSETSSEEIWIVKNL